jgi:hypothetical protein
MNTFQEYVPRQKTNLLRTSTVTYPLLGQTSELDNIRIGHPILKKDKWGPTIIYLNPQKESCYF